ncbi:MOSC domain-containing protein [Brevibacillus fulvus]|uniref:Uncharacterized protein YcbX n=1 Tax=Brevibacillus fulvus TaxID=1125967 RepID=A0A939BNX0_9BACL|nr:MOSC domain-containing protein [Brevibacillus fulvus]MBM7589755.1 uncharacterized protein YcbX [Brevibacillus fulvus]
MKKIGVLQKIYRHPVKAFGGELLQSSAVDRFGLFGDRGYYFRDESRSGKYLSADRVPGLLGYSAEYVDEQSGELYPAVRIKSPDGKLYRWEDPDFQREIAELAKRPVTPMVNTPAQGGANWEDHLLLVTDASLREIARRWGKTEIDPRRFRGNFVIALDEDSPFVEDNWFGRTLKINDVELKVNKHCERCMYINIDPDNLRIDASLLKTVVQTRENHFGVYASVLQTGRVSQGDAVYLLD